MNRWNGTKLTTHQLCIHKLGHSKWVVQNKGMFEVEVHKCLKWSSPGWGVLPNKNCFFSVPVAKPGKKTGKNGEKTG